MEKNENFAFRSAVRYNCSKIIALLFNHPNVDIHAKEDEAFRIAAEFGFFDSVVLLLTNKATDITCQNSYALRWASRKGYLDIVKFLLEQNSDDVDESFLWAAEFCRPHIVQLLLKFKPSIRFLYKGLHWAVFKQCAECVKFILDDPRVDVSHDDNVLIKAVLNNDCGEILRLLIAHPSMKDINAIIIYDDYYYSRDTLLQIAVSKKDVETVRILLDHPNIDVDSIDTTMIKRVMQRSNFDTLKLLYNRICTHEKKQGLLEYLVKYLENEMSLEGSAHMTHAMGLESLRIKAQSAGHKPKPMPEMYKQIIIFILVQWVLLGDRPFVKHQKFLDSCLRLGHNELLTAEKDALCFVISLLRQKGIYHETSLLRVLSFAVLRQTMLYFK